MKAEQYLDRIENKRLNSTPLYSREEMIKFAEDYHKAKVEAISDEDISLNTKDFPFPSQAIKWFKEQLLKQ